MEKENHRQLELFSQPAEGTEYRNRICDSFFGYIRNYEKFILLIIALLVTSIIFFSLGVEKGKKTIALSIQKQTTISGQKLNTEVNPETNVIKQTPAIQEKTNEEIKNTPQKNAANYTIQVATFSNKSRANKEIELLKKKGLTATLIKKGDYTTVCVGNFAKKEMAKNLLTELKKKYRDGFIRRL